MTEIVLWLTSEVALCNYCHGVGPHPSPLVALTGLANGIMPPEPAHTAGCPVVGTPDKSDSYHRDGGYFVSAGGRLRRQVI